MRRSGRDSYLMWGGWLLLSFTAFSLMSGAMHPYYTVLLAPAVAALIGLACSDLADAWDEPAARFLGLALLALGGAYALTVLGTGHRAPGWVFPVVIVSLVAAMLLLVGPATRARSWHGTLVRGAAVAAVAVSLLTGPTVFAMATLGRPMTGANPLAGPAPSIVVAPYDQALVSFLETQPERRWIAAVPTATAAARLQLQSGDPVLPLGGFTGHAGSPTVAQVRTWAQQGRLRYIVLAGPYATHTTDDPAPLAHADLGVLMRWARAHACLRSVPGTKVRVIDLRSTCPATSLLRPLTLDAQ
jgi:4-amino-4-deoxy-L-arabinose transferase-like glycosyltransferase